MGGIISSGRPTKMAMTFVTESIARDKVVIFSKTYCPYCTMAKEVSNANLTCRACSRNAHIELHFAHVSLQQFNKINQAFTAIELDARDDAADIQAVLGELTGATTVRNCVECKASGDKPSPFD